MSFTDTIFALSSGAGMAGIAVIRVSGPLAAAAIESMAGVLPAPRVAAFRTLRRTQTGDILDQGLVLWIPGPTSATGENVAEFHVHGSAAVIDCLCETLAALPGFRLAQPGEFMRRSFANGKLDLVEAEGLADLLHARTEAQRRLAVHHMTGNASATYESWRERLAGILGYLEASIDFVDEDGVAAEALEKVRSRTLSLIAEMSAALIDGERAGRVRDGVRIVLAGLPNSGKSSLLNAIAKRDAAIVSSQPGTTRDIIEVPIVLAGVPVILSDTAGLRETTDDAIEHMGVKLARRAAEEADLLVWLVAPDIGSEALPPLLPNLTVLTKADLNDTAPIHLRNKKALLVSAKTGFGIAAFISELEAQVRRISDKSEHAAVVRARHKASVNQSIRMLNDSLSFRPEQIELAAEAVRSASISMSRITGRIDVEDLLDKIFGEFCIGK
jgi:tRNA modification GTPase